MIKVTRHRFTQLLIAACVLTGLTLSGAVPAQAAGPDAQELLQEYGTGGLVQDKGDYVAPNVTGLRAKSYTLRAASATAPDSYSLRAYTMPVADQGTVNSCVSWTLGYNMLGWYSRYLTGTTQAYAPMYLYSQAMVGDDEGSNIDDTYAILGQQGIPLQSQYPQGNYDARTKPTTAETAAAAVNKVTAPHWLYDMGGTTNTPGAAARTAIQSAISAKHPVALSIPLYDPFYALTPNNSVLRANQITGANAVVRGAHEVLIVGYDSTGVIIQNQWGTSWGDGGFATLDWAFVQQFSLDASWIYGFQRDFNQTQVPAAVNGVTITGSGTQLRIGWQGTGAFDDAAAHPVTGYTVTLTDNTGTNSVRNVPSSGPRYNQWVTWQGLPSANTYTLRINATNAVGTGPDTTYSFLLANGVNFGPTIGADTPSPAMPDAAAQQPVTQPSQPTTPPSTTPTTPPTASKPATKPGSVKPSVQVAERHRKAVKVTAKWTAPKATGNRAITAYKVQVIGTKGGRVKYSHTYTYTAKTHAAAYKFTGKYRLVHGLSYKVMLTVKNSGNKWSTTRTTYIGRLR